MIKAILVVLFFAGTAQAGVPFWQAPQQSTHTAYGTGYAAGVLKIYPSTTTAAASPSIFLDGILKQLTVRNGAYVSTMTPNGFYGVLYGSATLSVAKTGDSMTGGLSINGSGFNTGLEINNQKTSASSTGANIQATGAATTNVALWIDANSATNNTALTISGPNAGANNKVIYSYATGQAHFAGPITSLSSMTANGGFVGNVTGNLTGSVTGAASSNVLRAGDTMTGQLTLAGSTLTVTGSAFSVGGSTLVVANGRVGVGTSSPTAALEAYFALSGADAMLRMGNGPGSVVRTTFKSNPNGPDYCVSAYHGASETQGQTYCPNGGVAITDVTSYNPPAHGLYVKGKAGIGINPLSTFHVAGDGTFTGPITASSVTATGAASFGGNVGIGTTGPSAKLSVTTADALVANLSGGVNAYFDLTDGVGTLRGQVLSNEPGLYSVGAHALRFGTNNTERMRITSGGNVGIGTTGPGAKLHVQDGVILSSTTAGFGVVQGYGSSGGCLMFRDTDNAGWTECKFLDGVMTCATDADGVCD